LWAKRPVADSFGAALVLAPAAAARGLARLELELELGAQAPGRLEDAALETLRREIPTARCLPLLGLLARAEPGTAVLDYLDELRLAATLAPCA
jgi:hypothetical protein